MELGLRRRRCAPEEQLDGREGVAWEAGGLEEREHGHVVVAPYQVHRGAAEAALCRAEGHDRRRLALRVGVDEDVKGHARLDERRLERVRAVVHREQRRPVRGPGQREREQRESHGRWKPSRFASTTMAFLAAARCEPRRTVSPLTRTQTARTRCGCCACFAGNTACTTSSSTLSVCSSKGPSRCDRATLTGPATSPPRGPTLTIPTSSRPIRSRTPSTSSPSRPCTSPRQSSTASSSPPTFSQRTPTSTLCMSTSSSSSGPGESPPPSARRSLIGARIPVAGAPHKHSFVRNGDEKRFTRIVMHNKQRALSTTISSGLRDLLVLKTTESSFEGFLRDEYTTLPGQYTAARSGSSATLANPPSRGRRQDLLHLDRLHLPTRAPAPFRLDCDHRGRPRSARCDDRLERDPRIDRHDHVRDVRDTQFGFGAGHALPDGHHDPRHAPRGQQRRVHSPEQGPFDPLPHELTADELVRFSTTLQST